MGRPLLVLFVWLGVILVSIHLPVRFQRRMIGGVQFPLAGLAAATLFLVLPRLLPRASPWAARAAVALGLVLVSFQATTPYYVWRNEWHRLRRVEYPSWLPAPLLRVFRHLAAAPGEEAVVVSSYETGNFIPHYTAKRCLVGHYALTIDAKAREADTLRFFTENPADDPWRREALAHWRARYVVLGPYERALGGFDPSTRPWLRLLRTEAQGTRVATSLYAVVPP
jgi:hypothetical protein